MQLLPLMPRNATAIYPYDSKIQKTVVVPYGSRRNLFELLFDSWRLCLGFGFILRWSENFRFISRNNEIQSSLIYLLLLKKLPGTVDAFFLFWSDVNGGLMSIKHHICNIPICQSTHSTLQSRNSHEFEQPYYGRWLFMFWNQFKTKSSILSASLTSSRQASLHHFRNYSTDIHPSPYTSVCRRLIPLVKQKRAKANYRSKTRTLLNQQGEPAYMYNGWNREWDFAALFPVQPVLFGNPVSESTLLS